MRSNNLLLRLAVIVVLALATGFTGNRASAHEGGPHVRIAHLAPAAPPIDVYVNDKLLVDGVAYRDVTDYMGVEGYAFSLVAVRAGGKPDADSLTKAPVMLEFEQGDGGFYTVAAVGSPADGTFDLIRLPADGPEAQHSEEMTPGEAAGGSIVVKGAFARATTAGESHGSATPEAGGMEMVSAAYMTIQNTGHHAEKLIGAATEVAGVVELHETIIQNDVARMEPIVGGIEIPAEGSVELKPGGKHIMLLHLKEALVAGHTLDLVLTFESGLSLTVRLPIVAP